GDYIIMYQALYRKWRPRTFDDVVGQEQITETLKNQIISGRLSHAYLFVGTRGTGKTTCAKILARAVNCEHPIDGNPCNECESCLGIEDGSIMDVVELDAASNNGVDNVRALRDEAIYSPAVVKKRVYIVDEVHMLSNAAFNALLKILEEPPPHLMFILATTEFNKVPATILSRCQRHSFKRIDESIIARRLGYVAEQEGLSLDADAAALLARMADGSLRDGLSLLDQCSGSVEITAQWVLDSMGFAGNVQIAQLLNCILSSDTQEALLLFNSMWRDGKEPVSVLSRLCTLLRDVLLYKTAPKGGRELLSGGFDDKTLVDFSKRSSAETLIGSIDAIHEKIAVLRDGRDPKIAAELCLVGLCEPDLGESLASLRTRVAKLEALLKNGAVSLGTPANTAVQPSADEALPFEKPATREPDPPAVDFEEPPFYDEEPAERDIPPFDLPPEEKASEAPRESLPELEESRPEISEQAAPAPAVQETPASGDGAPWESVLALLKTTVPTSQLVIINEAKGEIQNGIFTVSVNNSFAKKQLDSVKILELISAAVEQVLGSKMPVKVVEDRRAQAVDAAKLEGLSKFGNVKFE
ncbi:MAG: DNA polymerase III subunit gamma/tau, partial [Oscillospiraceae bacterium]